MTFLTFFFLSHHTSHYWVAAIEAHFRYCLSLFSTTLERNLSGSPPPSLSLSFLEYLLIVFA